MPLSDVGQVPKAIDVICGRGKAFAKHPGNMMFVEVICSSLKEYASTPSRVEKSDVIYSGVLHFFYDDGIRFLKLDSETNRYFVLSAERAYEKVGHGITDFLKQDNMSNNESRDVRRRALFPHVVNSADRISVKESLELVCAEKRVPQAPSSC
jgi:hypothetical protein